MLSTALVEHVAGAETHFGSANDVALVRGGFDLSSHDRNRDLRLPQPAQRSHRQRYGAAPPGESV